MPPAAAKDVQPAKGPKQGIDPEPEVKSERGPL
jgi:hypothetical protein